MTFQLLTPCCGTPIQPEFEWSGHGYSSYEVLVGFSCDGAEGKFCYNQWNRAGEQTYPVPEPA